MKLDIKESDKDMWVNWKHNTITQEFIAQLQRIRNEICDVNGRRKVGSENSVAEHNIDVGYVSCLQDLIEEIMELGRDNEVPQKIG